MLKILIIIGIIIIFILIILFMKFYIRKRNFKPTPDKLLQLDELNLDLKSSGFAYNLQEDYFYSLMNCWQREVGYCRLYDESAPLFNMIIDSEPVTFEYNGKRWLIEFWKGQYGITTGAEIGIYNTDKKDIKDKRFEGTFYETVEVDELIPMSFTLKKNDTVILKRSAVHWWLTGFKLGEFSNPDDLVLEAELSFPSLEMCYAFVDGLKRIGYESFEYEVSQNNVIVYFTTPHTKQPVSRNEIQMKIVQEINKDNCKLFNKVTKRYKNTLDKMEYLKAMFPDIYHIFLRSLYAKEIYLAFEWIREILFPKRPPKPPKPPRPCLPKPCLSESHCKCKCKCICDEEE